MGSNRKGRQIGGVRMKLDARGILDKEQWEQAGYKLPQFDREQVAKNTKENPAWIHFGGGEMYDAVVKFAKDKLALKSNVRYTFMGNVSKDIIMNYYIENSIDAFVMVSQSEGNPVSVMEAMSFGIPIITTNICNMPNMINGNGIVMDEESASGLAEAIRKLNESDLMEMEKMRNESRRLWEENYNEKYNNMIFLNDVLLRV